MLSKKIFLILTLLLISYQSNVLLGTASLRPIIINNNQSIIHSSTNSVKLTWDIIDDNPNYYRIYQNESILKADSKIVSNIINFNFNAITGNYNISLVVFDYSGHITMSSTIIVISMTATSSITSAPTSFTQTSGSYSSSKSGGASSGYTYLVISFSLLTITIKAKIKRNKRKKS